MHTPRRRRRRQPESPNPGLPARCSFECSPPVLIRRK